MKAKSATQVDIVVLHAPWRHALKEASGLARQAAHAALRAVADRGERRGIAIALGDDALLQELNFRYRGKDKPTNVLSFEAGAADRLGDIALSLQTLKAEAKGQGKTLKAHFQHMVVHGTLHLLGFDHERPGAARKMEKLEREILAGLGVDDPYEIDAPALKTTKNIVWPKS